MLLSPFGETAGTFTENRYWYWKQWEFPSPTPVVAKQTMVLAYIQHDVLLLSFLIIRRFRRIDSGLYA